MFVVTNYYKTKISIKMYVSIFFYIFNTFIQFKNIYLCINKKWKTSINTIHSRIFIRLFTKKNMIRKKFGLIHFLYITKMSTKSWTDIVTHKPMINQISNFTRFILSYLYNVEYMKEWTFEKLLCSTVDKSN